MNEYQTDPLTSNLPDSSGVTESSQPIPVPSNATDFKAIADGLKGKGYSRRDIESLAQTNPSFSPEKVSAVLREYDTPAPVQSSAPQSNAPQSYGLSATTLAEYGLAEQPGGINADQQGAIGDIVDAAQKGVYDGLSGIGETFGADSLRDWASENSDAQVSSMSDAGRDALNKQFFEDGEDGIQMGDAWSSPRAIAMQAAHMMGLNADILAGGLVTKGGRVVVTKLAKVVRGKLGKKIKDPKLLQEATDEATKTAMQKMQRLGGQLFDYGTATHAVAGGMQAIDAREEVEAMDFQELANSTAYVDAVRSLKQQYPTATPTEILTAARSRLGEMAASQIKTNPTLLATNYLVGGLGGLALDKLLRGAIPKVGGVAAEVVTEGVQGAGEQFAANQVMQDTAKPNVDLSEGVLSSGLNEAVAGGVSSAGFAGGRKAYEKLTNRTGDKPEQGINEDVAVDDVQDGNAETEQGGNGVSGQEGAPRKAIDLAGSNLDSYYQERYEPGKQQVDNETGEVISSDKRPAYLMNSDKKPFKSQKAALSFAKAHSLPDYELKKVDGGYVMQRPDEAIPGADKLPKRSIEPATKTLEVQQKVKHRQEQTGEFVNTKNLPALYKAISDGKQGDELQRAEDAVFQDPMSAYMRNQSSKAPAPAPINEAQTDSDNDKYQRWVKAQERAVEKERLEENFEKVESQRNKPVNVKSDYSKAIAQRMRKEQKPKFDAAKEKLKKPAPTVKEIAAQVKRKRKAFKKKLFERGIDPNASAKVSAVVSTYNKPFKESPGYVPANVFADAIMGTASVKKAIEKAPAPEKERQKISQALIEMAQDAEDELMQYQEQDDFEVFSRKSREESGQVSEYDTVAEIEAQANEAATSPLNDLPEPTVAQQEAGNYKKGKVKLHGMDIAIENPKGSQRKGVDSDGKSWSTKMKHHYGDLKGTTGADGDPVDVFIGDNVDSDKVYIVDQVDPSTGEFDEHKVMLGFDSKQAASDGYQANYDKDWQGAGDITEMGMDEFKAWSKSDAAQKPAGSKVSSSSPASAPMSEQPKSAPVEYTAPKASGSAVAAKTAKDKYISTGLLGLTANGSEKNDSGSVVIGDKRVWIEPDTTGKYTSVIKEEVIQDGEKVINTIGAGEGYIYEDVLKIIKPQMEAYVDSMEPATKSESTPEGDSTDSDNSSPAPTLTLETYTEKSFIVKGETKTHLDKLKSVRGLWNKKNQGWVYSNKHKDAVQAIVDEVNGINTVKKPQGDSGSEQGGNAAGQQSGKASTGQGGKTPSDVPLSPTNNVDENITEGGSNAEQRADNQGELDSEGQQISTDGEEGIGSASESSSQQDAPGATAVDEPGDRPNPSRERSDAQRVNEPVEPFDLDSIDSASSAPPKERTTANINAIRTMKQIMSEGRRATEAEKQVMAKYVGWGGLKSVFNESQPYAKQAIAELKSLVTENEFNEIRRSVTTAFYTSREVVKAMWEGVKAFGVLDKTTNVLEPTVGSGNFIGWQPPELRSKSRWSASELDTVTGNIARLIYDDANVQVKGFQDARFKTDVMGLAIGNPPFGAFPIHDSTMPDISGMSVHNYIIAKTAKLLHENGLMLQVITSNFLDTQNPNHRELSKTMEFIGAVRLPNTTFKKNAGTEVVTDIVVFRKLKAGEKSVNTVWQDINGTVNGVKVNKYFEQNPQNILGTISSGGTMYRGDEMTVSPSDEHADLGASITKALTDMAANVDLKPTNEMVDKLAGEVMLSESDLAVGGMMLGEGNKILMRVEDNAMGANIVNVTADTPWSENGAVMEQAAKLLSDKEALAEFMTEELLNEAGKLKSDVSKNKGFIALHDYVQGKISKNTAQGVVDTAMKRAALGETRFNKLRDMLGIRNTALALIKAERQDAPNIEELRKQLNAQYQAFADDYGKKGKPATIHDNLPLLKHDYQIETGLDNVSSSGITKGAIFTTRMNHPYIAPVKAATVDDGVTYSVQEHGTVNVPYIAGLLGVSLAEARAKLTAGERPYLLEDPTTGEDVFIDEYLSGNVKEKLRAAEEAGMAKNVALLTDVLPEDKPADSIKASMRAVWIDPEVFETFLADMGIQATVTVSRSIGKISVTNAKKVEETELSAQFKNEHKDVVALFEAAAAGKSLPVFFKTADGNSVKDEGATKIVNSMLNKMGSTFATWVDSNPDIKSRIAENFNERVNTHIERKFNGRLYLKTVGMNPKIDMRKTQLDGALRMIQSSNTLLDHTVGAGKTFTAITGMMERKRLGLSRKSMLAVPNHIIGQFTKDIYALYPGAKVLAVSEKQFSAKNRKQFFARIATGDYDIVVIGHSHLKFIDNDQEVYEGVINEKLAELRVALEEAKKAAKDAGGRGASVNQIENSIGSLNDKLKERKKKLAENTDAVGYTFSDLGVDYLSVDEAHEFKNLMYSTRGDRVVGMNDPKGSERAMDLLMKVRAIQGLDKGGVTFMTGTPVSNSLVELYTMMYYLGYNDLKQNSITHFDAFAGSFLNTESALEYTATGAIKERTVLKGLNAPGELSVKYRQFADVVTHDDMVRIFKEDTERKNKEDGESKSTRFPVPDVVDGGRKLNIAKATDAQREYNDYLIARMEAINNVSGKEERLEYAKIDNPLWVMNDAKKASLDVRMVDPTLPRDPTGKIARSSDEILKVYKQWNKEKGTQLVFSDMGTPVKTALGNAKSELVSLAKVLMSEKAAKKFVADKLAQYEGEEAYTRTLLDISNDIAMDESLDSDVIEKAEEAISDLNGTALVADSGFSVYDDLKTALVEKGIPENEIAFIHDANTDIKKLALFDQVKSGDVRVLIGSTRKMGAGTNVQDRLVALHHMDAPWRPSDMEQREGRIIRQGNTLYGNDPDNFKVKILAYSTEGSSDPVMWQILERKASAIEQFRRGDLDEYVEDDAGDADSYAEFKAATTGNIIYKLKLQSDSQVVDLNAEYLAKASTIGGAQRVLRDYEGKRSYHQNLITKLKDTSISRFDAAGFADMYQKEVRQYNEAMTAFDADTKKYDALSDADKKKKENKKPKRPKIPALHEINHPFGKALKAELVEPINKFIQDKGRTRVFEFDLGNDIAFEVSVSNQGEEGHYDFDVHSLVGNDSVADTRFLGLKTFTGSQMLMQSFLPDRVNRNIAKRFDASTRSLAALEKNKTEAQTLLQKVDTSKAKSALENAKVTNAWLGAEAGMADIKEDIRRGKEPNKYIDGEQKRKVTRSGFSVESIKPRTVVFGGESFNVLGVEFPEPGVYGHFRQPAINEKGEYVHLIVAKREDEKEYPGDTMAVKTRPLSAPEPEYQFIQDAIKKPVEKSVSAPGNDVELKKPKDGMPPVDNVLFSKALHDEGAPGTQKGLTEKQVKFRLEAFKKVFKGAKFNAVHIKSRPEDSFGPDQVNERGIHKAPAAYDTKSRTLFIFTSNIPTEKALYQTLRHEVLVHQGLGMLTIPEQKDLLEGINATRNTAEGRLRKVWDYVLAQYPEASELIQAEEVLARIAERSPENDADSKTAKRIIMDLLHKAIDILMGRFNALRLGRHMTFKEMEKTIIDISNQYRDGVIAGPRPEVVNGEFVFLQKGYEAATLDKLGVSIRAGIEKAQQTSVKSVVKNVVADSRKNWLGLIPRRYLGELSEGAVPSIFAYLDRANQMDADRNHLLKAPALLTDEWRAYAGKHKNNAKKLAKIMHLATIAGVDPSKEFEALKDDTRFDPRNFMVKDEFATGEEITAEYVNRRIKEIREIAKSRPGENTKKFLDRIEYLKSRLAQQRNREKSRPEIERLWQGMDSDGQALFEKVRDAYTEQNKEYQVTLEARITDLVASERDRAAWLGRIRQMFETQRAEGPYFPLQRFGDYFAVIKDRDGHVQEFTRFEKQSEQTAWVEEQRALLPNDLIVEHGKMMDSATDSMKQVDPEYHAKVMEKLEDSGVQFGLMNDINQLYLEMLPEMSMRKHFIHRKKTAGYNADALRAFSHNMFHGGYQLSKLKHSHKMEAYLKMMEKEAKEAKDTNRAADIVTEMKKRHQWAMNPKSAPWAANATSIGFAWYLGVTPAAAMVNVFQTPMMAFPVLGSRFGFAKSAKALFQASKDFVAGRGNLEKRLSGAELAAFKEFERSGLIEKTLAHDLAGVSEGGLEYSSNRHKVMTGISYLFHHAERFNREVTAMAAYRLARDNGAANPITMAEDLTKDAHFDYGNAERARFMQNDAAKVLLLFRQHSVNMTYRMARDFNNMFRGVTPEVKQQARRQFIGVMGMGALFAGAAGLPMYSVVSGIINLALDDEDDPFEFETEFRLFLAENIGEEAAKLVVHGALDSITGATISSRVGLNNLWLRDPDATMEGRALVQYYAEQALGPMFGIALSAGTGLSMIQQGQGMRGVEQMMPKAMKDVLRTVRYSSEGVVNMRGDALIDELNYLERTYQLIGLTPSRVSEQYEQNRAIKTVEKRLLLRRQVLLNRYALATRLGDNEWRRDIDAAIKKFNKTNPSVEISSKTKLQSISRRATYSQRASNGIILDKRLEGLADELRFISD